MKKATTEHRINAVTWISSLIHANATLWKLDLLSEVELRETALFVLFSKPGLIKLILGLVSGGEMEKEEFKQLLDDVEAACRLYVSEAYVRIVFTDDEVH